MSNVPLDVFLKMGSFYPKFCTYLEENILTRREFFSRPVILGGGSAIASSASPTYPAFLTVT